MRNALHTAVNSPHDPETAFRLFDEAVAHDDTHTGCAFCGLVAGVAASIIAWGVVITLASAVL